MSTSNITSPSTKNNIATLSNKFKDDPKIQQSKKVFNSPNESIKNILVSRKVLKDIKPASFVSTFYRKSENRKRSENKQKEYDTFLHLCTFKTPTF